MVGLLAELEAGMAADERWELLLIESNPEDIAKLRWDELKVADRLEQHRAKQPLFKGTSFETIAAYGAHGAVIHYKVCLFLFLLVVAEIVFSANK